MLEFGVSFKKARESRNVSIDKIALETRISKRFLLAIETEQFDVLPGGIFNRGFIRTYAERLGLDPEEAIRTYEKLSRSVEMEPVRHETERVRGKTTKIPVYYAAIAGLLLLVVAFYFATRHAEPPIAMAVTANSPAPAPPAAKPEETPVPTPTPASPVADSAPKQPASEAAAPEIPKPERVSTPTAAVANAPVVLELEVREESWFKLSADGSAIVVGELLPAGTTRRYTANNSMDVSIGNAAGVLLRVNGQPVSSLGRSGQVRSMTITPKTSAASLADGSR